MHPLKAVKEAKGLTYREMSDRIKKTTKQYIRPELLAQYAGQLKIPSAKRADVIHRAYPEISRESILYPAKRRVA
ncbi:MAG: hypothetical protein A2Z40_04090 [Deltaproteobacteria bacterium RBG_19FT_COMBO_60_16]|nr:MAG: hypothetical protein A2Z40_04090 [Deltaproteobacteria bacterium RBG_19FT_COMBO_60_16]